MTNKEYYKAYREKNKEKYNLRRKEWYENNREILKIKEKEYRKKIKTG